MIIRDFGPNTKGSDFVVGDLHGCYQQFFAELNRLGFNEKTDRVFSVGDLVDRGPDSMKCARLIERPWFFSVLGNHEQILIDYADDPGKEKYWRANGGGWCTHLEAVSLASRFRKLPLAIDVDCGGGDRFLVAHAQFPFMAREQFEAEVLKNPVMVRDWLVWEHLRHSTYAPEVHGYNAVFHGHTVLPNMSSVNNHIYIDTGAFFAEEAYKAHRHPGKLTVLKIETDRDSVGGAADGGATA